MLNHFNKLLCIPVIVIIFLIDSQRLSSQTTEPFSCDGSGVPAFDVSPCSGGSFIGNNISTRDNNLNVIADVDLVDIGGATSVMVLDGTEFCDHDGNTGLNTEGPDVIFNIPVDETKRESCEAAQLTITLRGDFNNGCEVAYIVNECGIIIQQSDITGLPERDKCDVVFPLSVNIPAADVSEMAADGIITLTIRTNGGTNGLQSSEVDGTCDPSRSDVDCVAPVGNDGNCIALEAFIWPIDDNAFSGTLNSTENILCPGESLNIDVLQNLTFPDPLGIGDGDDMTGTYHLDFYFGGGPNPANPYDTNLGGVPGDVINAYNVPGLGSNPSVSITNNGGTGVQDHTNSNAPLASGGGTLPSNMLIEVLGSVWVDDNVEPSAAGFCTGEIIGCGFTTDYVSFVLLDPIAATAVCGPCLAGPADDTNTAVVNLSGFTGGLPSFDDSMYTLSAVGGTLSTTSVDENGTAMLTLDPGHNSWAVTVRDNEGCVLELSGTCGIAEDPMIHMASFVCLDADPFTVSFEPSGGVLAGPGITGSTFDPFAAGIGMHEITYTVREAGCQVIEKQVVNVDMCTDCVAPTIDIAASPICYTDGSSTIQFFNSDGTLIDLALAAFTNGDFTDPEVTVNKVPSGDVDGNNHDTFNAVTFGFSGASSVFQLIQADDVIRINPEHLIGESFEFAGIYEICLNIPSEENDGCEDFVTCGRVTLFPSMEPCFDLAGTFCESSSDFRINVGIENPFFDDLPPDLLGRSRNEMSRFSLIAPDGTLIQEDETGFNGLGDGDVIIEFDNLFSTHGPGLYTINHEMGIDICATFCSRTFEIIEEQEIVLQDLQQSCIETTSGSVSLSSLIDPANSTLNALGGTWSLTSGPAGSSVVAGALSYTTAGCYEVSYTPPTLASTASDCEADEQSAFVLISEQPQPSFDIQDQVCFSAGDASL